MKVSMPALQYQQRRFGFNKWINIPTFGSVEVSFTAMCSYVIRITYSSALSAFLDQHNLDTYEVLRLKISDKHFMYFYNVAREEVNSSYMVLRTTEMKVKR